MTALAPSGLIVIFGAKVRPDGIPTRSLVRRIDAGIAAARAHPEATLFCSGGFGRQGGPSEASVMRERLVAAGVEPARIVLDEESRDTLQSVVAAVRYARIHGLADCIVCSDRYHLPRIRLTFALLGLPAEAAPVRSSLRESGLPIWLRMSLREAVALPYDAAIVLARRKSLLAEAL